MPVIRIAKAHAAITLIFWVAWLAAIYWGSRSLAAGWPGSGDILGVVGTLLLFLPNASLLAWDVAARLGQQPKGPDNQPLPASEGYAAFSWRKVWVNAIGITLIGLGFGVSYFAEPR